MASAARAISADEERRESECNALFECASSLGTWDPVVTST